MLFTGTCGGPGAVTVYIYMYVFASLAAAIYLGESFWKYADSSTRYGFTVDFDIKSYRSVYI